MAVAALRAALESERSSLQEIDASIKRIVQAPVPRHNHHERFNNSGDGGRGPGRPSLGARSDYTEELGKRRYETKTVFSRLSTRTDGESDHEENTFGKKPRVSSQVTRDLPSKQEIMKAQCGDEQSKTRNRRMFGSLLGTLQKFKQEEIVLKGKEEKKAEVERRIEQQAQQEKEKQKRERQTLFADRELKKATIKALEAKLGRVAEFDAWADSQRTLGDYLLTRAKPPLYWLPKRMDPRTEDKLALDRDNYRKYTEKKRKELEEELIRIEQKCLRSSKGYNSVTQSADSKENKMADRRYSHDNDAELASPRKREKFISEARTKDENGTFVKIEEEHERRKSKREDCKGRERHRRESERGDGRSEEREKGSSTGNAEGDGSDSQRERKESEKELEQNSSPHASPESARRESHRELQDSSHAESGEPGAELEAAHVPADHTEH